MLSLIAACELKFYFLKHKDTCLGTEDLHKAQKIYMPNLPICTYIIILKKNPKTTHRIASAFYTAGKHLLKLP